MGKATPISAPAWLSTPTEVPSGLDTFLETVEQFRPSDLAFERRWSPSSGEHSFQSTPLVIESSCSLYSAAQQVHVDLLDAVRIKDGKRVVIKMVKTDTFELPLLLLQVLNENIVRNHPDNKIVEVLDMLLKPDTDETALVVMPHLMNFALIPFQFVGEMTEVFVPTLYGFLTMIMSGR